MEDRFGPALSPALGDPTRRGTLRRNQPPFVKGRAEPNARDGLRAHSPAPGVVVQEIPTVAAALIESRGGPPTRVINGVGYTSCTNAAESQQRTRRGSPCLLKALGAEPIMRGTRKAATLPCTGRADNENPAVIRRLLKAGARIASPLEYTASSHSVTRQIRSELSECLKRSGAGHPIARSRNRAAEHPCTSGANRGRIEVVRGGSSGAGCENVNSQRERDGWTPPSLRGEHQAGHTGIAKEPSSAPGRTGRTRQDRMDGAPRPLTLRRRRDMPGCGGRLLGARVRT